MSEIPDNLGYTKDHEWVGPKEGKGVKVGITDYAQDALGDVVFVDIPTVGEDVTVGQTVTEVESTKSVSDIYAPLNGTIVEVNEELDDSPELLNSDPYGEGWIFAIEITNQSPNTDLLPAEDYTKLIEG